MRRARSVRFIRFLFTGILNTLFGYAVFLICLATNLIPEFALAIATVIGAFFNYLTATRMVFGPQARSRLPSFIAIYAFIYGLNTLAIRFLVQSALRPAVAQGLLAPLMAIISYLLFRNIVFKASRSQ
jgi:putative flippase GtrA